MKHFPTALYFSDIIIKQNSALHLFPRHGISNQNSTNCYQARKKKKTKRKRQKSERMKKRRRKKKRKLTKRTITSEVGIVIIPITARTETIYLTKTMKIIWTWCKNWRRLCKTEAEIEFTGRCENSNTEADTTNRWKNQLLTTTKQARAKNPLFKKSIF